jgi:MFS family permease
VLRHRDYRLLWGAELVSTLGTRVQQVAIAWQVFELTGDPFQLGLLGLFRFVPVFVFGLVGGVVADRRDRRRTLVATQSVLLLTSTTLAGLTITGAVSIAWIYAVTFVSTTVGAIGNPARQALIPALVPRGEIAGAMSMSILGSQVAAVSGPALGGLTIGAAGVATAYALDALTFAAVILAALAMRARPAVAVSTGGGLAAAIEGLRFLRGSPILLGVMSVDFLATFFGASTYLMPVFAEEILGVGPRGLGLLLAAPAAGAILGSAVMGSIRMPARPGAGVLLAVAA